MKSTLKISLLIFVVAVCALGFLFSPNDPFHVDMAHRFLGSSLQYPFGTDLWAGASFRDC